MNKKDVSTYMKTPETKNKKQNENTATKKR